MGKIRNRASCEAVINDGGNGFRLTLDDLLIALREVIGKGDVWKPSFQTQLRNHQHGIHLLLAYAGEDNSCFMAVAILPGVVGLTEDAFWHDRDYRDIVLRTEPFTWHYDQIKYNSCEESFRLLVQHLTDALARFRLVPGQARSDATGYIRPVS